jgi:polar amino acid transport system permease protein
MDLALYSLPFLWQGTLITLGISALVSALSLVLGVVLGTLACYGPFAVRWAIRLLYCDVIRGIPVLVLIFTIYYGLPLFLGFEINSFVTAVVALTVFTTAQVTEIARGAIQSDRISARPRPARRSAWASGRA